MENYNIRAPGMEESKKMAQPAPKKDIIKIQFDASGTFLLTSCTDKYVRVYDVVNLTKQFKCVARVSSGELTTGFCFSDDNKVLITSTGDGCLFFWRIPLDMINVLNQRLEMAKKTTQPQKIKPVALQTALQGSPLVRRPLGGKKLSLRDDGAPSAFKREVTPSPLRGGG